MEYVINNTELRVDYHGLREAFPNNFIPAAPTVEYLNALGVSLVIETFPPEHTEHQRAVRNGVTKEDGIYSMAWRIEDFTEQEIVDYEASKNPVPTQVTRRQARQALMLNGLLDLVPGKIAEIIDPIHRGMAQIEWEDSQVFERNRPLVISIGLALGLDNAELDALFIQAGKL